MGSGIELAVVTYGLDFYVEALLESANLQRLPTYAVGARFSDQGIDFEYRYTREDCTEWGNCKCSVVDGYRERGYRCTTRATAYPIIVRRGERTSYSPGRGSWTCASRRTCQLESLGTSLTCSTIWSNTPTGAKHDRPLLQAKDEESMV